MLGLSTCCTVSFAVACAVFIILFSSFNAPVYVEAKPIVLGVQKLNVIPKEFYIARITDERIEKNAVAWVFPLPILKQKPVLQEADLQGGGLNAIQNFIWQSFPQDKKSRPIVIRLKECKVTESLAAPGRVEGKLALSLAFDLAADPENIHLTDYRIDTKYNRPDNQLNLVEPALRESLISALKYFNNWMNSQANSNPKLATNVKVIFKDFKEKAEGDTIYYAVNRPLTWNDFQEKPRSGKFAAVVFPSLAFEEKHEIINGEIRLHIDMKVYVPKSACWVKDGAQNDYTLNHEQRHFDIAAIVGKRFERKINAAKLPVSNFNGIINVEYYESFREMNHLQDQYDNETQHGLNTTQQEQWNKRIDRDLNTLGVKN
ncbi:MAG: hypothetical protein EOP42_10565 [Sphingobacteriaceae bacterium]|nr:MAG: hypothetical protein EOP42_10565 [Sphingobacteriaceae bacterium]